MEEYSLTLEHVRQFLATKQDNDEIGICFNSMYCLLSETLNWLYPRHKPWRVDIGSYMAADVPTLDLDGKVDLLRSSFDFSCPPSKQSKPITKAQLREYLTYFTAERNVPVPFTVVELFDVPVSAAKE